MRPWRFGLDREFLLAVAVFPLCVAGSGQEVQSVGVRRSDDIENVASERTFLFGKLVLVPVLAALGIKFLALLPIVLSKIALLSFMNFLSTNLNLIVSTLFGLKNFLGKHGLWAQEDMTRHPELETFAELANQPLLQPSFKYQYLMDKESRISPSKPPKFMKVFNGFAPSDGGILKMTTTYDRRIRDDSSQFLKDNEVKSNEGGKYKCYWTSDDADSGLPLGTKQKFTRRRKFNVADRAKFKAYGYGGQLSMYGEQFNDVSPTMYTYTTPPNFHEYLTTDWQVATHGSAERTDDDSGMRDGHGQQPFTGAGVKVAENYGQQQSASTAAKFKDDEVGN